MPNEVLRIEKENKKILIRCEEAIAIDKENVLMKYFSPQHTGFILQELSRSEGVGAYIEKLLLVWKLE